MTAQEFKQWRVLMGFNRTEAAAELGLSRNMPRKYENGEADVPRYVALACAALAFDLQPWRWGN